MRNSVVMSADVDTKAYMKAMSIIAKDSLPTAVAETLNMTADAVTKQQISRVKRMTIRTPYTLKSMQSAGARPYKALNKARGHNLKTMFSRAGTFSSYLWKQDEGGDFKAQAGGAVPIATRSARTGKSINKAIAKRYRLKPGALPDGPFGETGKEFIGSPRGTTEKGARPRGLYVRSGNNKRLTMVRNLESDVIHIKPTGFHSKSVDSKGSNSLIAKRFKRFAQKEINKVARRG